MHAIWNASESRVEVTRNGLGTVSHATMRDEDLIPCFLSALQDILASITGMIAGHIGDNPEALPILRATHAMVDRTTAYVAEWLEHSPEWESDEADEILSELFDQLEEFAPTGFYFGAHPGDGIDYGYWESEEAIEERETAHGEAVAMVALLERAGRMQSQPYRFPAFTSVGGYTLVYVADDGEVICADCVNSEANVHFTGHGDGWRIDAVGTYDEGPTEYCGNCNAAIESSYGDPEESEAN